MMENIDPKIDFRIRNHLLRMGYNTISNYIVPGLVSTLIGEGSTSSAKIRLFSNTRTQDMPITPHSHRFDLACMVLRGRVENTLYRQWATASESVTDDFAVSKLKYGGSPGVYTQATDEVRTFARTVTAYEQGQWYFMSCKEIHSIKFGKDAMVLIFEGPNKVDESVILEPHVDGKTIHTFKVEDWMFQT